MADRIELRVGDLPWQPHAAEGVVVLNHYDMPLAGVIRQHGNSYFFWCLKGEVTQGTLWGYLPIADQERHEIEHEPRDLILRNLSSKSRPWTLAFSVEGRGIVKWRDLPEWPRSTRLFRTSDEGLLDLLPEEKELLDTV
ncbi:MAG: hypothetical protein GEU78_13730 [Actinobacteria bacterium]|nr:hypothetical protein [Actinomycetota bacterium]